MGKVIILLIAVIIIMFGVMAIYDARKIAITRFSDGETNSSVKLLKVAGFIASFIGMGMILFII